MGITVPAYPIDVGKKAGVVVSPDYWLRFAKYWGLVGGDFGKNLLVAWPILAFLVIYALSSATVLYSIDQNSKGPINTWWDALYFTWLTMTTVGMASLSDNGFRWLMSVDVFMGLITIGVFVWLVTSSLMQDH